MVNKATRQLIRHFSLDILQRTPTPAEIRASVGFPVDVVAKRMIDSLEAKEVWIEEELLFFLLLDNFRPHTKAIDILPSRLHNRSITVHDAIGEIMMSTGFTLRNPGNDTFVTVVLEQGLGMKVQERRNVSTLEAGKKMYDGYHVRFLKQRGNSQSDIIKIVVAHRDFTRNLLDRLHIRVMRGPLPKGDVYQAQIDRVHVNHDELFTVLLEWFTSEEYVAQMAVKRPRTDNQFIRSLYFDLLERAPNYQEFRNMRNALFSMADPAPLRSVMAKVILDSGRAKLPKMTRGEEASFIRQAFLRYLGREPTQREQADFIKLLKRDSTRVEHVVRALITSPEYQYY